MYIAIPIAPYLAAELERVAGIESRRRLRSADTQQLIVPKTFHKTIGDRAFPVAAARLEQSAAVTGITTFAANIQETAEKRIYSDNVIRTDDKLRDTLFRGPEVYGLSVALTLSHHHHHHRK